MKKNIVATMLCTLGLCVLLAGCGAQKPNTSSSASTSSSDAPKTEQTSTTKDLPNNSILSFFEEDGAKWLVRDMDADKVPQSCTVLYDEEGGLPVVTVTDEDQIKEIYELVKNITVSDKSDMSTTNSYHFVSFKRQDGSSVGFRFEGEGNLVERDDNYSVEGDDALWAKVRELQSGVDNKSDKHEIVVVSDEDNLIMECPASAAAGETVQLTVNYPTDVQLVVRVDGKRIDSRGMFFEFEMPDRPVGVEVYTEAYPNGGGS